MCLPSLSLSPCVYAITLYMGIRCCFIVPWSAYSRQNPFSPLRLPRPKSGRKGRLSNPNESGRHTHAHKHAFFIWVCRKAFANYSKKRAHYHNGDHGLSKHFLFSGARRLMSVHWVSRLARSMLLNETDTDTVTADTWFSSGSSFHVSCNTRTTPRTYGSSRYPPYVLPRRPSNSAVRSVMFS